MNKATLVQQIKTYLENELIVLLNAANQAHSAAVDEQSIAETQYDTLAIEAGYLAEGQSKRANTIQIEIKTLEALSMREFTAETPITLGALVQLSSDENKHHWFFILPVAAGFKGHFFKNKIPKNNEEQAFTVISPHSPMGKALLNQYQDDEIQLTLGSSRKHDFILKVA